MEIWRDIKGYEELYQVSNYGRLRSLNKFVEGKLGSRRLIRGRILAQGVNRNGYNRITLNKNKKRYTIETHILVWDAFGSEKRNGHKKQIDHVDNNKQNNNINNLQLLTNRANASKRSKEYSKTSEYTGVCLDKRTGRWIAQIREPKSSSKDRAMWLGRYQTEIQAYLAYQKALISFGEL